MLSYALIKASRRAGTLVSMPANSVPGALASMTFTGEPITGVSGKPMSSEVAVTLFDAFGNLATSSTGPVSLVLATKSSGPSLGGDTSVTPTNGVAAFPDLVVSGFGIGLVLEAESGAAPSEQIELRVGMSRQEVETALAGMLATVPDAVGVNNHEGSRATANETLMAELMPALRERGLFYIDSRTTAATVAYGVAERSGVRAASRKVFLDDVPTKEAVLARLNQAARDAVRDDSAIAIGHPYRGTIEALAEAGPQLASRGIRLVLVSDLVH